MHIEYCLFVVFYIGAAVWLFSDVTIIRCSTVATFCTHILGPYFLRRRNVCCRNLLFVTASYVSCCWLWQSRFCFKEFELVLWLAQYCGIVYCAMLCIHLQDDLYRKAVLLETLLSNCDLDLVCMQKIIFAIDDVLYSLPPTMTNAIFVHQQARRHYCHHSVVWW